ncbi:MAG: class I SAM-dependent methyltransferase [Candidatus Eisenbacteria bacterium]|nr:class I SAM-dependent methyltransferase [Candidatus Eisenbacteria bacterium]
MRESTRDVWERYWEVHADADELYSNEDRIVNQLVSSCPIKGQRVLEVGAGSGRDSVRLVHLGGAVFVIDYAESSLAVVRREASAAGVEVHLVRGDATGMPFKDACFDALFHQGLMEHFRDPSGLLDENRRVLKTGGVILVDVPQRYHIYTLVKHFLIFFGKWFAGWETEFTVGSLERLIASRGFRVKSSYGDWMVPGFFYRGFRYVLRQLGVARLPKYPRPVPLLSGLTDRFRNWFRKKRLAFYTFAVVGTVARKE